MPGIDLDRNFRLPSTVRPSRYVATVTLDPADRKFSGRATIELALGADAAEIALHAIELELDGVACHVAGRRVASAEILAAPAAQAVVIRFPEPLPTGRATLEIAWAGRYSPGLRGLYAAGPLSVTQFEAADARRVFPCFDEPAFKVTWKLSLRVPKSAVALGNAPVAARAEEDGLLRVDFEETPPLSSYLVALAVGNLQAMLEDKVRGVPVRTWAVPEKAHLSAFGQQVAVEMIPRLEDYFDLPYAFGKLDQVGVPEFEAGAMENAGLITYRETALLLDPATASLGQKKRVAEVVTHELAHQWFGNWVTMVWWDDLWLNEAFATWMAYKMVDAWKPEWRVWLDFDQGKAAALHLDALRSTHPIHSEVKNADEATESFDVITYEKGGAVLRMIEGWLGEEPFREGMRLYMRRHGKANAVADDLWRALGEASRQPVLELANGWIRQDGFPLVEAKRDGARLKLSQRRFFSDAKAMGQRPAAGPTWPVPMMIRWEDARGVREQRHLFRAREDEVVLAAEGDIAWVSANGGATGFYRVAWDAAGVAALSRHAAKLAPAERIALLSDGWALVRAGLRDIGAFLDLCAGFGGEEDYAVLDELAGRLAAIEQKLLADADRPRFEAFVASLLGPALARLGWDPAPGEPDPVRLRRATLVRALGITGREPGVVAEATRRLDRFIGGDRAALEPNLHETAVVASARGGDADRFERYRQLFAREADPAFKRRYLLALAAYEDTALAARGRELALSDEVPLQDFSSFVAGLLSNRTAREPFWQTMRHEWARFEARASGAPMLLRRVVEAVGLLPERRHFEEAQVLFKAHPLESARQAIAQTLERMGLDADLRDRAMPVVGRWLTAR